MSSNQTAATPWAAPPQLGRLTTLWHRIKCWRAADMLTFGRRVMYFWLVWSALLLIHEGGHAFAGRREGLSVRRITVGVGPVLWRGQYNGTETVLRLVPIAGSTQIAPHYEQSTSANASGWSVWGREVITIGGGVAATLALAIVLLGAVMLRERRTGARWILGRMIVADAVVLTVFNFLPVPPLDGGRAVIEAFAAWHGAPMPKDALFWVQVGGLALAVVPMTLWTRWTTRIDAVAMSWRAPRPVSSRSQETTSALAS